MTPTPRGQSLPQRVTRTESVVFVLNRSPRSVVHVGTLADVARAAYQLSGAYLGSPHPAVLWRAGSWIIAVFAQDHVGFNEGKLWFAQVIHHAVLHRLPADAPRAAWVKYSPVEDHAALAPSLSSDSTSVVFPVMEVNEEVLVIFPERNRERTNCET